MLKTEEVESETCSSSPYHQGVPSRNGSWEAGEHLAFQARSSQAYLFFMIIVVLGHTQGALCSAGTESWLAMCISPTEWSLGRALPL